MNHYINSNSGLSIICRFPWLPTIAWGCGGGGGGGGGGRCLGS